VRHPCGEAITRLRKLFLRQFDCRICELHLLCRGIYVEKRCSDFRIDASLQVRELVLALLKAGFGLIDVAADASFFKNRHLDGAGSYEGSVRISRIEADVSVVAVKGQTWEPLKMRSSLRQFRSMHLRLRLTIVQPRLIGAM